MTHAHPNDASHSFRRSLAERPDAVTDPARLGALKATTLVDSAPEESFDRLVRMASNFLDAPVAMISLVDDRRQFFKSAIGLPEPWATRRETPLSHSFCRHVVTTGAPFAVNDAREHPLVMDNPAIDDLGVVAYAGAPLVTSDGHTLGALCVIDMQARDWTARELDILRELADSVIREIEVHEQMRARRAIEAQRERDHRLLRCVIDSIRDAVIVTDLDGRVALVNDVANRHIERGELVLAAAGPPLGQIDGPTWAMTAARARRGERVANVESVVHTVGRAEPTCLSTTATPMHDAHGVIVGAVSVVRNVSVARRTQAALSRSEELYRTLARNLPNTSVLLYDHDLRFTLADGEHLLHHLGLTREALVGRTVAELAPGPNGEAVLRRYRAALEGVEGTVHLVHQGRALTIHNCPVHDEHGAIVAGMVMSYDVTELKRAERSLRDHVRVIALLQAVTVAANEAQTSAQAFGRALADICAYLGWPVGHVYLREGGELVSSSIWHVDAERGDFEPFRRGTEGTRFADGVDFVGSVAARRTTTWLAAIDEDSRLARAAAARASGLRCGLAVPILVGPDVVAVLEFYSVEPAQSDANTLALMSNIGTQLGRVVERERHAESLRDMSIRDELTRLYNRRGFLELARHHLKTLQRTSRYASLFYVDLNGMKAINDLMGHDEGDRALADTGRLLSEAVRTSDVVARLGGDEFAILALETGPTHTETVRARLEQSVEEFNARAERSYRLSLSIGATSFDPEAPRNVEELLTDADERMYEQKRARRVALARQLGGT